MNELRQINPSIRFRADLEVDNQFPAFAGYIFPENRMLFRHAF
jgi:hypothetical protein